MQKENANINNIRNIEFFAGDVEKVFENVLKEHNVKPDVIFVDPPRKGLDKHTIENILNIKPEKIVYISCNPASLVRDLKLLEESYEIKKNQPVDMFPFTSNVECVTVLYAKRNPVILEFTAFHRFYTFEPKATFGTKKKEIDRIFVKVEFNLECGNI